MARAAGQPGDLRPVVAAAAVAFLMVAQHVAGKAARDGFFLQHHDIPALSRVMTAAAALGLLLMLVASWLLARLTPHRATPIIFGAHAAAFLGEAWLAQRDPPLAATVTYLHTGAFAGIVASAFWSSMNERFDPHAAKRAFTTINVGATAGGVAGGLLAWKAVGLASMATILVGLAAISAACTAALVFIGNEHRRAGPVPAPGPPRTPQDPADVETSRPGPVPFRQRYLVQLAGLVVLVSVADTLVEFVFKAQSSERLGQTADLLPFFALFYAATSIATFLLQVGLSDKMLARLGLSGTAGLLPLTSFVGAALALVAPGFWTAVSMRAATLTTENSLFRSAYELAYTPLPPGSKRRLKAYIDVGLARLSVVASGAVTIALSAWLSPEHAVRAALLGVLVAAAASVYLSRALKGGYRSALEQSLRSGAVALSPTEIMDADTRQSYGGALVLDRRAILAEVQALEARQRAAHPPERGAILTGTAARPTARDLASAAASLPDDPFAERRRQLRSGDPVLVRQALGALTVMPRELICEVIPLLASDPVLPEVLVALRGSVDRHTGALTDALLDPETPTVVRRRLSRVLQASSSQRAVAGLTDQLADPRFELRLLAGAALVQLHLRHPELAMDGARVLAVVRRELGSEETRLGRPDRSDLAWLKERALFTPAAETGAGGWWLVHVFNLLALLHDPDVLRLAFAALASNDTRLRGTGLEYLEVVLPPDLGARLVQLVSRPGREPRPARAHGMVVEDLLASRDSLEISSETLAKLRSGA
jgi:ATP:ADP antiporter, AAA family